jgi:hypothetical protein
VRGLERATLLDADPAELTRVEAKRREIERRAQTCASPESGPSSRAKRS